MYQGAPTSTGSRSSSTSAPPLTVFDSASPEPPRARFAHLQDRYPKTAGDPQFDYCVDDPCLLPEQPGKPP
ncbi:hypothetical protein VPH35_044384 [Triticum aestivum]